MSLCIYEHDMIYGFSLPLLCSEPCLSVKIQNFQIHYAGNVAIYNCVAFWGNGKIIFRTGDMAIIHVLLKDDYNNSLSPISSMVNFSVMAARRNGVSDVFSECHLDFTVQDAVNYKLITFWTNTTGIFRLQVGTQKMNISNSPLTFTVLPGNG